MSQSRKPLLAGLTLLGAGVALAGSLWLGWPGRVTKAARLFPEDDEAPEKERYAWRHAEDYDPGFADEAYGAASPHPYRPRGPQR